MHRMKPLRIKPQVYFRRRRPLVPFWVFAIAVAAFVLTWTAIGYVARLQ